MLPRQHVTDTCLQDEANKDGGKWIVRLRKGLASRCWENLLLALLGIAVTSDPE